MMKPHPAPRARHQRGVALIDALIAILIFSFGLLALVGLQANMTQATGSAKIRADAAGLGADLVATIWADGQGNVAKYDDTKCDTHGKCKEWKARVTQALPGGNATIRASASGSVDVAITWATSTEGTHTYVLASTVLH